MPRPTSRMTTGIRKRGELGTRDRFKEAPWFNPDAVATIGGVGSIGSWLVLFLSRILNTVTIYDMDHIEPHNLSGQFFDVSEIGLPKTSAISAKITRYSPACLIRSKGEFKEGSLCSNVMFACFDNMKSRRLMFEEWMKLPSKELFIDGRLTAEQYWIYAIKGDDVAAQEKYNNEFLLGDEDFEDLPCSFKSTTHIASMLASMMTSIYTNYIYNKMFADDIREIPFETSFVSALILQNKE